MIYFNNLFKCKATITIEFLDEIYKEKGAKYILMIEKQNKVKLDTFDDFEILKSLGKILNLIDSQINLGDCIEIIDNKIVWKKFVNKRLKKSIRQYFGVETDLHKRLKK